MYEDFSLRWIINERTFLSMNFGRERLWRTTFDGNKISIWEQQKTPENKPIKRY